MELRRPGGGRPTSVALAAGALCACTALLALFISLQSSSRCQDDLRALVFRAGRQQGGDAGHAPGVQQLLDEVQALRPLLEASSEGVKGELGALAEGLRAAAAAAGEQADPAPKEGPADEAAKVQLADVTRQLEDTRQERDGILNNFFNTLDADFLGDVEAFKKLLAEQPQPYFTPEVQAGWKDRGIVISAGGAMYTANAFVNAYVIRHHFKCKLPIVLMYWGAAQRDSLSEATLQFLKSNLDDVEIVDASKVPYPKHQRWLFPPGKDDERFHGWKVKAFVVYAAPFNEMLFLDSDSSPLIDPTAAFELEEYKRNGNAWWPDIWCTEMQIFNKLPGITNPWAGGKQLWQTESGQFVLNRAKYLDMLEWFLFLNVHDSVVYRWAYGDKDTFRVAFDLAGKVDKYELVEQPLSLALYQDPATPNVFTYRGFVHHHPNSSVMYHHRAGTTGGKYDPNSPQGRSVTHLMLQPSCAWKLKWYFAYQIDRTGNPTTTPKDCKYSLLDMVGLQKACGLAYTSQEGPSVEPPVVELSDDMPLAATQQAADAAFALITEAKRKEPAIL